ncbi:ABC transporter substrate-binding protein [Cryobacterium arcticum]|uniref:ABC transporter substrate-binding protein n=1 Tax=Cryobacterium arcticum TaxID=670052 RepID=UPI0015E844C9|nr:ABC transporter substrate-binding protein [Cryobacterium arcticum]
MTDTSILAPAYLDARYGSAQADGIYPRTVRHFGGKTVLTEPPTRFVAISTGNLDGAVALGVVPVASTHNDSGGLVPDYLRATTRATVGDGIRTLDDMLDIGFRTAPDLDLIASLEPTLIIASFRGFGGREYAALSVSGPTVLPEGKGFNWKQDLLLLASAMGRTDRALDLLGRYSARTAEIAALYRAAGSPTISAVRFGPLGLETHGTWSFCGSVLSDFGALRPAAQSRHDNGTRRPVTQPIADLNADLLFYTRVDLATSVAAWAGAVDAGWNGLPVVAEGRAFEADAASWHGHAGILAAFCILDQVERAISTAS